MKPITLSRTARPVLLALLALATSACMVGPHEGQYFASRSTPIQFHGYVDVPNAPVKIYAQTWSNPAACGYTTGFWSQIASATSSGTPIQGPGGASWYSWQVTATVPSSSWCLAPGPELGGLSYSTNIYGRYRYHASQLGTKWRTLQTSDENTVSCSAQQDSGFEMIGNCSRINEDDWWAVQIWAE